MKIEYFAQYCMEIWYFLKILMTFFPKEVFFKLFIHVYARSGRYWWPVQFKNKISLARKIIKKLTSKKERFRLSLKFISIIWFLKRALFQTVQVLLIPSRTCIKSLKRKPLLKEKLLTDFQKISYFHIISSLSLRTLCILSFTVFFLYWTWNITL